MSLKLTRRALLLGLLCAPLAAQAKPKRSKAPRARKRISGRAAELAHSRRPIIVYVDQSDAWAPYFRGVLVDYSGQVKELSSPGDRSGKRVGAITVGERDELVTLLYRCEEGTLSVRCAGGDAGSKAYTGFVFGGHGDVDAVVLDERGDCTRLHSAPEAIQLIDRFDALIKRVAPDCAPRSTRDMKWGPDPFGPAEQAPKPVVGREIKLSE